MASPPIPPLGVILAGGRATRLGGADKAMVPLGAAPLLAHAVARLRPQVLRIALNANGDPARFAAFALPVLADADDTRPGPLAGVLAGLDWAAGQGAEAVVTVAVDTPFLPPDLVAQLLATAGESGVALAATREQGHLRRHPTVGLWPVALREDLRAALAAGTRRVALWADRHDPGTAVFDDPDAFFNVNAPEDLARAEAMLSRA